MLRNENNDKQCVLVTGCSSGIGECVAHGLHERGYRVFATVRNPDDASSLRSAGMECLVLDYSDSASIKSAVEQVLEKTNDRLFALFNNGAYGQPGACEDLSREAIRQQFETNVFGWMELTNLIIPIMRAQGYGRIIQNSSILGFTAMSMRGAYNASKFAIEGFTDTMRLELAGSGIHVSLIEPGPVESRFRSNAYRAFQQHIDAEHSVHHPRYQKMIERFETEGNVQPFTLPPDAVLKRVVHALESRRPKIRYPVTFPTYLFAWLKRILSHRMLDRILARVG
ncbi:MAG: NAD(P)-dependent dehydrogenase (short-subunit alcohol dehydrogenase family) [Gammaproteobacteria bacterium]|jgi:NAD(P)-dependent dehydrogenase (short-subunit alcohol dehydrogenase family)